MINNKDNINNDNTYLILFIVFLIGFIVFLIGFIYYCQHSNTDKKNFDSLNLLLNTIIALLKSLFK